MEHFPLPIYSGRLDLELAIQKPTRPINKECVKDLALAMKNSIEDFSFPIFVYVPMDEVDEAREAFRAKAAFKVTIIVYFLFNLYFYQLKLVHRMDIIGLTPSKHSRMRGIWTT